MMDKHSIGDVLDVIDDMQGRSIIRRYAIGGAFAATLLDEPISTIDLDIFFFLEKEPEPSSILSLTEIYDYARSQGFAFDHEYINIHGWLVQFVEASHNTLWTEAIDNAKLLRIGKHDIAVIQPNYLVLMWLMAGRQKDFVKIGIFLDNGLAEKKDFLLIAERLGLKSLWDNAKHRFGEK